MYTFTAETNTILIYPVPKLVFPLQTLKSRKMFGYSRNEKVTGITELSPVTTLQRLSEFISRAPVRTGVVIAGVAAMSAANFHLMRQTWGCFLPPNIPWYHTESL